MLLPGESERRKGVVLIRGYFEKCHLVVCMVVVVPRNTGIRSTKKGLFSKFHLVVLVVSSVQKKRNNPLPKQPPSNTLRSFFEGAKSIQKYDKIIMKVFFVATIP